MQKAGRDCVQPNLDSRSGSAGCQTRLAQHRVLGFSSLKDGDVRIGVFPQREEILIRLARGCVVAPHRLRSSELQMRQRSGDEVVHDARIIDDLLELHT
jgi:hypothetical protein